MIADVLPRLERAKQTARGNWIAICPAHNDRSPSLTLHETPEGRIVCRCWAGCTFEEIVTAVGLGWEPWFPPKQAGDFKGPIRRPYPAADVLAACTHEVVLTAIYAADMANGNALDDVDRHRLLTAAARLNEAKAIANG